MLNKSPNIISDLKMPVFLLAPPFSLNTSVRNNIWMEELDESDINVNSKVALRQFYKLYSFMSSQSLVYLLPSDTHQALQDQVYVANLGIIIGDEDPTAIVANFASEIRRSETPIGVSFFESLGYKTEVAPYYFEGEAELKHLHSNVLVGGYGIRSDIRTYDWMEEKFNLKIVKVEERDPYLYHLDCSIFPLDKENTLVYTGGFNSDELKELEKVTNVISINKDVAYSGICNSVRVNQHILCSSNINDLKAGTEEYIYEMNKSHELEKICSKLALTPKLFNLSEYMKSGALLSCMVMHLNRYSYKIQVI
ncbi:dimethylarginine dimethylaminohydrolase family protein [Xenorhabdus miraniensis]|uniref:Amidinotransferase n=1 Tax=Xenorhabdus miraniensis TaxID=351674 RepID=A0A2D0JNL4_9GAMM|nr:arginine deiminase-related protein [Xenorhabdus miraniensis]PHM47877.1 amidinotransferase [Xenorhabdus miraniensis]